LDYFGVKEALKEGTFTCKAGWREMTPHQIKVHTRGEVDSCQMDPIIRGLTIQFLNMAMVEIKEYFEDGHAWPNADTKKALHDVGIPV